MGIFDSIAGKLASLAVKKVSLDDARARHAKRPDLRTQFDYAQIGRDWKDGKISADCYRWLELVIITEAGTPVYTDMLLGLEDADLDGHAEFKGFVRDVWTREESQHGAVCMAVGDAIGFRFDLASVRRSNEFLAAYLESCPPCRRVLGTVTYAIVQEEITYWSHRAYAELSGSAELARVGRTIAAEERYHSLFYASRLRDALAVAQENGLTRAEAFDVVAETVQRFDMPTVFHREAYAKHVTRAHSELTHAYIRAHMADVKRQLGPLFIAAGGLALIDAIRNRGFPLGRLEGHERAELTKVAG